MRKGFIDITLNGKNIKYAAYVSNVKKQESRNVIRLNLRLIGNVFLKWLRLAMHKQTGSAARYTILKVGNAHSKYWVTFTSDRLKRKEDPKLRSVISEYEAMKREGLADSLPKHIRGRVESFGDYVVEYWYLATGYGGVREHLIELWNDRLQNKVWPLWGEMMWRESLEMLLRGTLGGASGRAATVRDIAGILDLPQRVFIPKYMGINDPEEFLKLLRKKHYYAILKKKLERAGETDSELEKEKRRVMRRIKRIVRGSGRDFGLRNRIKGQFNF